MSDKRRKYVQAIYKKMTNYISIAKQVDLDLEKIANI